jgi:hypothetical protein
LAAAWVGDKWARPLGGSVEDGITRSNNKSFRFIYGLTEIAYSVQRLDV